MHHWMMASAATIGDFRGRRLQGHGRAGAAADADVIPENDSDEALDVADRADAIINRWCLDAMFKGRYPPRVMEIFSSLDPTFAVPEADFALLAANPADFLGVNFYAPVYVRGDTARPFGFRWHDTNPDPEPRAFNGPVRPDYLKALLERIRDDYGNLAGLHHRERRRLRPGRRGDAGRHRARSAARRLYRAPCRAALAARREGCDLRGCMVWSLFDNFEWLSGYGGRFRDRPCRLRDAGADAEGELRDLSRPDRARRRSPLASLVMALRFRKARRPACIRRKAVRWTVGSGAGKRSATSTIGAGSDRARLIDATDRAFMAETEVKVIEKAGGGALPSWLERRWSSSKAGFSDPDGIVAMVGASCAATARRTGRAIRSPSSSCSSSRA